MSSNTAAGGLENMNYSDSDATKLLETTPDSHPLFQDDGADIILRSSDDIDFHFYKSILSLVSTVFSDMFALSKSSSAVAAEDRVTMAEDSKSLALILTWCHPKLMGLCKVDDLEEVTSVLLSAEKYVMDPIREHIQYTLMNSQKELGLDPVRIYYIAYRFKFEGRARLAAQRTLAQHGLTLYKACPEMELISGLALSRLLQYHAACCTTARAILLPRSNNRIAVIAGSHIPNCNSCPITSPEIDCTDNTLNPPGLIVTSAKLLAWVVDYLSKRRPIFNDRFDINTFNPNQTQCFNLIQQRAKKCNSCRDRVVTMDLFDLQAAIKTLVTDEVSKIALDLPWAKTPV
jgi:hypothetical protein